jgi:hypothetical protein
MRFHHSIRRLARSAALCCALLITGCSRGSSSGGPQEAPTPAPTPAATPAAVPTPTPVPPELVDAGAAPTGPDDVGPLADCEQGKVRCRRMPPQCPEGQVASVAGSCFGPCVAVERCACSATIACPQPEKHACWHNQHCGPFVR